MNPRIVFTFLMLSFWFYGCVPRIATKPPEIFTPPKGAMVIFDDVIPSYGYTYPEGGLFGENVDEKKSGLASLEMKWRAGKGEWCGGGIGLATPIDLTRFRETGKLVFWIKGRRGFEKVRRVGLQDSGGYASMRPLGLYCREILPNWQKVTIPLAHFSDDALRWDAELKKEVPGKINWSSIVQFKFDFGEGTGEENTIYVDEILILP